MRARAARRRSSRPSWSGHAAASWRPVERKLAAIRERSARAEQAEQDAALAAQAAAEAAYEAQWRDSKGAKGKPGNDGAVASAPAFGAPIGAVLPSLRDDTYDVESLSQVPTRPELELAAVAPPTSEIVKPEIEIEQAAIIPRPFRNNDETVRR